MNNKGQITVFLSLLFSSLLVLFLAAVEIVSIYMNRAKVAQASKGASESIKADYNIELFDNYHLLLLDKTYMGKGEGELENRMSEYLEYTLSSDGFEINDVILTDTQNILDNDCDVLKDQIEEYMKLYLTENIVESIANELTGDNSCADTVKEAINQGKDEESDETSDWDGGDIRDTLKEGMSGGLLNIVLPSGSSVSKSSVDTDTLPSKAYVSNNEEEEINTAFDNIDKLEEEIETTTAYSSSALTENYYGIKYAMACFDYFTNSESYNNTLQCEVEYLIAGKDNDYDNLSSVVNRIVLHRLPVNIAVLLTDKTKMAEIESMALAISLIPGITYGAAKYLLAACYAYGETIVEVRSLLAGNHIAGIKTSDSWLLDIENFGSFATMNGMDYSGADALDYEDFLMLFLAESPKKMYYRMCDIMQLNVSKTQQNFLMENCINAFSVDIYISNGENDYSISSASSY